MSHRSVVLFVVQLMVLSTAGAEDWCCKFTKERKLALQNAGPVAMKEVKHVHAVSPAPVPLVSPPSVVPGKKVLRTLRKKRAKTSQLRKPELRQASPQQREEISAKARLARDNGQLEHSLRLYRIAQQMDPGSSELAQQIAELEKEMK